MSPPREKMPSENKNVDPTVRLLKAIGRRIAGYVTAVQRTSRTIKTSKLVYSLIEIALADPRNCGPLCCKVCEIVLGTPQKIIHLNCEAWII